MLGMEKATGSIHYPCPTNADFCDCCCFVSAQRVVIHILTPIEIDGFMLFAHTHTKQQGLPNIAFLGCVANSIDTQNTQLADFSPFPELAGCVHELQSHRSMRCTCLFCWGFSSVFLVSLIRLMDKIQSVGMLQDFVHEQHHRFANCLCPEMALFLNFLELNIQKKSWVCTITIHGRAEWSRTICRSSQMRVYAEPSQASTFYLQTIIYCKYSSCLFSVFLASVAVTSLDHR